MLMQDNQLFTCPAVKTKPLKRVLDAGCGTGIWSIDFGASEGFLGLTFGEVVC